VKSNQIEFLLLSNEPADTLRTFLSSNQYSLPVYIYKDPLPENLGTSSFPTTYIINKNGMIVFKYKLSAKWNDKSTKKFLKYLSHIDAPDTTM
jgi:hypothetical protein